MNQLFNYLWEASLTLLLLFVFYQVFLARLRDFSWNRVYLLGSLLFAMVLPFLSFSTATTTTEVLGYNLPEFRLDQSEAQSSIISPWQVLLIVYWVGVLWKLGMLSYGLLGTWRKISSSPRLSKDGLCFVIRPDFRPSSFFHFVFLPRYEEQDPELDPIILHESVHAKRWHSLDLLLLQSAQVFLWFHPVWTFFESSLREVHEFEADQEVTAIYPKTAYAKLLLGLLVTESQGQLIHNFNQFQTKKRIKMMMNKEKSSPLQKTVFLLALPLLAVLLVVFACEPQQPEPVAEVKEVPIETAYTEEVFDVVEVNPQFNGGMEAWTEYLSSNLRYPEIAKAAGIEGTVYVVFEVRADGKVVNHEIVRGIGGGCDEEALRVVSQSPDWIPGRQKDRKVNVRVRVPIKFALSTN